MGDPLSIAGAAVGMISLGIEVSKGLVTFYMTSKNQDETIARTVRKLENLLSTLETLEKASQTRRFKADEVDQLRNVEDSINNCSEVIAELKQEVVKFSNSPEKGIQAAARRAGGKLAYPFRESTLKKLDEDVSEFRNNLVVALNVLQLKRVDDIQDDTADLTILVNLLRTSQISDTVRGWLKAPDATFNHVEACKRRHPRTGLWLVNGLAFQKWLEDDYSFLWINGRPGCGKTVLSSTAIQYALRHRRSNARIGIAFHYFSFSDISKQNVSGLLRTLLLQLSSQVDDGHAALDHLRKTFQDGEPPIQALADTLKQLVTKFVDVYVVIDALDESPRGEQRIAVLDSLSEMRGWSISGLHLLVTSRDEPDIREQLSPQINEEVRMDNSAVDQDIKDYIVQRLQCDRKLKKFSKHHAEIEKTLIERAGGVFRWVDCQFLSLTSCPSSQYHLQRALNSLPRSLDETHNRMLMNIDPEQADDAKRILTWLCFSRRPVTIPQIIEGLMVDLAENPKLDPTRRLEDTEDIIRICPGLISISTSDGKASFASDQAVQDSFVRIAHFSVQEYLESDRIKSQTGAKFAMHSRIANTELAKTCLVYLRNVQLTYLEGFPLASYAAEYWYQHLLDGDEKCDSLNTLATDLLMSKDDSYEDWIRIHDPYRPWQRSRLEKPSEDIASPLYYVSLLGLYRPLQALLKTDSVRSTINEICGGYGSALKAASHSGHKQMVQLLLDNGAEINAKGGSYGNALQAASEGGHEKVVQLLLERGAEINAQGEVYGNALQAASWRGHEKVVQLLLERGAEINAQGGRYGNALQAASAGGHEKVVQLLLERGAEINAQGGRYGNALQAASEGGHEHIVRLLLDQGADINAQGTYGSALRAALQGGHENTAQLLLDRAVKDDGSALYEASIQGFENMVQLLRDNGAEISTSKAMQTASREGDEEVVQLLLELERGARITNDVVKMASRSGHETAVHLQLDRSADIDGDAIQATIHMTPKRGKEKVVQVVIDRGVKIDSYAIGKALETATERGYGEVVQLLLDSGVEIGSYAMEAALETASRLGDNRLVQLLLERGAGTGDKTVETAIVEASKWGYEMVVQVLLDTGAKIDVSKAIEVASEWGREKVVQLLQNHSMSRRTL